MARSLGIFVTSNNHLDKIINLCKAAKNKGVEVSVFFTHRGTLLTQDPRFTELKGLGDLGVCRVSFEANGFKPPIQGLGSDGLVTQAMHADIIDECDRYLVF